MLRAVRLSAPLLRGWGSQTTPRIYAMRWESTGAAATPVATLAPLPPAPTPPTIVDIVPSTGEPTLAELGIGGWTPSGMMQQCFEFLHINLSLPWWGAIVVGTICLRTLMFPAIVISQRNTALMQQHGPRMEFLQHKVTEARQTGDHYRSAQYSQNLAVFMSQKNINPIKNAIVPLIQMPFFISTFFALRTMSNCPVESMMTGGMLWFTDLTIPDQYYALPIFTSLTMYITIALGIDGQSLTMRSNTVKYIFKALPFVILPFLTNFPSAILCYWFSSNIISLLQSRLLKFKPIRERLNIIEITTEPFENPNRKQGFLNGLKHTWRGMKSEREIGNIYTNDQASFNRAGRGPLVKTFKFDPTKVMAVKSKRS